MRPTKKEITLRSPSLYDSTEHTPKRDKIKSLMQANHSCLSCTYFLVAAMKASATCRNPRKVPKNAQVKHYNICELHFAIKDTEDEEQQEELDSINT
jgi:hypothetical protein